MKTVDENVAVKILAGFFTYPPCARSIARGVETRLVTENVEIRAGTQLGTLRAVATRTVKANEAFLNMLAKHLDIWDKARYEEFCTNHQAKKKAADVYLAAYQPRLWLERRLAQAGRLASETRLPHQHAVGESR